MALPAFETMLNLQSFSKAQIIRCVLRVGKGIWTFIGTPLSSKRGEGECAQTGQTHSLRNVFIICLFVCCKMRDTISTSEHLSLKR